LISGTTQKNTPLNRFTSVDGGEAYLKARMTNIYVLIKAMAVGSPDPNSILSQRIGLLANCVQKLSTREGGKRGCAAEVSPPSQSR
jgi:hypothetical protein